MVHPRRFSFSKSSFIALALAFVGFFTILACWRPELTFTDRSHGDGEFLSLSDRQLRPIGVDIVSDEGDLGNALQVSKGEYSPRVTPKDSIRNSSHSSADSPDSEMTERIIAERMTASLQNKASGLRMRLLMEAAERALHSTTPWSDLAQVALAFKRIGDPEAAKYWFERASRLAMDPDDSTSGSRSMREVVKSMVAAGYFDLALDLIARIPLESEKSRARSELVSAYARLKKFDEARLLTQSLNDPAAKALALRGIAESEARYLDLSDAMITLGMITGGANRDIAYGRVAAIRAGIGDSAGAMQLINRIQDPKQRDTALARVAEVQSRGGSVSYESLVGLIHDPAFRDETLRILIANEASRRDIDISAASANRIETAAERAKAYESLVMLQLSRGDLDGALERAQSIRLEDSRFRALQAVAVAMVRDAGVKAARNVTNLIGDQGLRDVTFRKIAQRAALIGRPNGAEDTIQFISSASERAMAFASVALTQARYGGDERARLLVADASRELEGVESAREQALAKGVVAEVYAEIGDAGSAFEAASGISNSGLRDLTYRNLALSFAKSSNPGLAEESAQKIERENSRETTLDSIALTLASRVSATDAMGFVSQIDGYRQQVRFLLGVAGRKS